MTPRTAEAYISYLTFSIKDSPVILRVVKHTCSNAVPYGENDLLRV